MVCAGQTDELRSIDGEALIDGSGAFHFTGGFSVEVTEVTEVGEVAVVTEVTVPDYDTPLDNAVEACVGQPGRRSHNRP